MDLAIMMNPVPGEQHIIDDFAMQFLRMMGYAGRALGWNFFYAVAKALCSSADRRGGCMLRQTVLWIVGRGYLLVQEDRGHLETVNPEPQLIAKTIATVHWQSNNQTWNLLGVHPLNVKAMAGITIKAGTCPTHFSKFPSPCNFSEGLI